MILKIYEKLNYENNFINFIKNFKNILSATYMLLLLKISDKIDLIHNPIHETLAITTPYRPLPLYLPPSNTIGGGGGGGGGT